MHSMTAVVSRSRRIITRSLGLAALVAAATTPAMAQNLVTNGNFETGNLDSFTKVNPAGCGGLGVFRSGIYDNTPGGSYSAIFNGRTLACSASLSQTLNTMAGQKYDFSFFALNPQNGQPNNLKFTFGNQVLFDGSINNASTAFNFQQFFGAQATATSGSTLFTISGFNTASGTVIDDVSLTPSATSTVPEPSSMALLGTGLIGLVPMIRRRRRA